MLNTSVSGPQLLILLAQQVGRGRVRAQPGRHPQEGRTYVEEPGSVMLKLCPKWIPWAVGKVADDIFRFPMSPVLRRVVASAPASLPTEGKGSGAVQSLFPWFCLCFQRAFKSFDDVCGLWEVMRLKLGTPKVDCTPPACGEKLQVFLPPFLPGFGWCSVTWSLIRLSTLLPPCWSCLFYTYASPRD